jgi:L-ascorbate metabolism protein UlaG (beta-lactamase superfamily)
MRAAWLWLLLWFVGLSPQAQGALKAKRADSDSKPAKAQAASETTNVRVRWYGHAFIYLTSSCGVRVAIDPFGKETVKYLFPSRLPADVVLISSEGEDHAAAERLCGNPQVFRSITANGVNRASGLTFKGVEVYKDSRRGVTANRCTAFVFELDGVKFAHLGVIGDVLDSRQREEIGGVDVVFLPVGNPSLRVSDLNKIVSDLGAKIIVPVSYRTASTGYMELRGLEDYLKEQPYEVNKIDGLEFTLNASTLPQNPTVYVLNTP